MDINSFIEELKNFDAAELQNVGQAPLIIRFFFWMVSFVAALLVALVFLSEPKYSLRVKLTSDEVVLKDKFVNESRQAANKDKFEAQLIEIQKSFGVLLKKLPEQIEVDRLIGNINEAAQENQIKIIELNPGTKINKEFYFEFPLSISFTGTYHNIGRFFSQLSGLTQIITMHDVRMARFEDANQLTVVRGEAVAKTYSYVSDESRN